MTNDLSVTLPDNIPVKDPICENISVMNQVEEITAWGGGSMY